jgi:hypothetical protein
VKRHVGYLREMGALAWVQHGTRTNIRRLMGLKGYAATATIYAAVIPAAYDHAMGHRIIGTGYTARIVIDEWGQAPEPVDTCGNSPVDNSAPEALEPPSLTWLRKESKVEVEGGCNYTEQARPPKARIPHQSSLINGRRRTAADVQKASNEIRMVRALVNWTQSVPLRRLEFVLRPWTDRGWDALRIADELHGIRARIAADTAHQEALAQAVAWEDSTAYREMATMRALLGAPAAEPQPERERTDEDRLRARMDWNIWPEVIAHFEEDELDALDLYGKRLVDFAIDQHARTRVSDHAYL